MKVRHDIILSFYSLLFILSIYFLSLSENPLKSALTIVYLDYFNNNTIQTHL